MSAFSILSNTEVRSSLSVQRPKFFPFFSLQATDFYFACKTAYTPRVYGITNIMLTKSLQELKEHYLVNRKQYDTISPKVEYSLTEHGKTLIPLLKEFDAWGKRQQEIDRFAAK